LSPERSNRGLGTSFHLLLTLEASFTTQLHLLQSNEVGYSFPVRLGISSFPAISGPAASTAVRLTLPYQKLKLRVEMDPPPGPESAAAAEAAERLMVEDSNKAGSAAYQFRPDATPEEKGAQAKAVCSC
jgi:hypothetical protein